MRRAFTWPQSGNADRNPGREPASNQERSAGAKAEKMSEPKKYSLALVFGFYLALSIILTWPLAASFSQYPLFDHLDVAATFYNFWWQYYSIFKLHASPWFNTMVNYPDGYSMVFFPLYLAYGIFSWPLQALFGTPQALPAFFNWVSILSFALTGLVGFLLFRELAQSFAAALIAGILFSFLPFHYWHLPRCHTSCLELLLLPIYFYYRLLRRRELKAGAWLGLSLVPVFYQSPNYVIYLTIFFALNLLYMVCFERGSLGAKWLRAAALAFVVLALLTSPFLWQVGKELVRKTTPATGTLKEQAGYSANLVGFVLPGSNNHLLSPLAKMGDRLTSGRAASGQEIFPGYLLLFFGLLGIFFARKNIRHYGFWLCCLFCFLVLSLGPYLNIGRKTYWEFPLPYFYLRKIFFFFQMDRSPVRAVILALLALAVFANGFLAWLQQKFAGGKSEIVFGLVGALALLELNQAPVKVSRVALPKIYQEIASEPGKFAILELPLLPDIYRFSGFFQPWHQKRLALDLTARKEGASLVDDPLLYYFDEPLRFFALDANEQKRAQKAIEAELERREIKFVIVYLKFIDAEKRGDLDRLAQMHWPVKSFDSAGLYRVYQFSYGGG